MAQRFYPYAHAFEDTQPILCIASSCLNGASWWDAEYGTYWCDFHAIAEISALTLGMCTRCGFFYSPALLQDGICIDCRVSGPLVKLSDEVMQ